MKLIITLCAVWVTFICSAQKTDENYSPAQYKNTTCRSSFNKILIEGENSTANIQKILQNLLETLKDNRCALKLNYINQSPGGIHYSFTQLFNGVPVYQSEVKVNTDHKNTIRSIFDNSYNTKDWNLNLTGASANSAIAISPQTFQPILVDITIENRSKETLRSNGEIIFQRDMNSYFAAVDSTVRGKVFLPDPLTTANQLYGGMYVDNLNTDAPWLDAQEQTVQFKASFDGATFTLQSPFVVVSDFEPPAVAPATSNSAQFFFNRSQEGFNDVNAFYHISSVRDHVAALGFNCADSLISIDTHADSSDNSFFAPTDNPHRIYYGLGGVDDAQDADVCTHEYGHSLSYTAAPGSNVGLERAGLDEAFGDYTAASYSKSHNIFNDQWIFNWDGHNEFWPGRIINYPGTYPDSLSPTNNIYHNGEIWSSMLFSLNGDLGRDITDALILQTHYSYAENISMIDAAQLLIDADTLLNNGAYFCPIFRRLLEHKLNPFNAGSLCLAGIAGDEKENPFHFMQQGNSFTLLNDDLSKFELRIINITGQQLIPTINENQAVYNYQNANLPAGIYLVNVIGENASGTFKWVKIK